MNKMVRLWLLPAHSLMMFVPWGRMFILDIQRSIVFCSGSTCFFPAQTQLTEAGKFQSRRLITVIALNLIQESNHAVEKLKVEANQLGCWAEQVLEFFCLFGTINAFWFQNYMACTLTLTTQALRSLTVQSEGNDNSKMITIWISR